MACTLGVGRGGSVFTPDIWLGRRRMRRVVVKTLGLVASLVLLLTACGGAWSILQGERLPGEVAARPEVQTPIERTIDNFTLGMAQEEALAQFATGLQQR